jgi:hypothetical protein
MPPHVRDARGRHDPALRATGFSGVSRGVTLTQWLEMVEVGRRDAQICLRDKDGNLGFLWCKAGEIIDAETGALRAEEAVQRILELDSGEVSIEFRPCERPRTIQTATFALLWEGTRHGRHSSTLNTPLSALGLGVGGRAPASVPPAALARRTPSVPLRAQRPDTDALPSIRPHTASLRPSSKLPPPGSAALDTWSQQRAFGLALLFIGGLAGVWLLSLIPAHPAPSLGSAASQAGAALRPAAARVASPTLLEPPRPPPPIAATAAAKPRAAASPLPTASVTVTPIPVAELAPVRASESTPRPAAVREAVPRPRRENMSIELTRGNVGAPAATTNNRTPAAAVATALRTAPNAPTKKPEALPIATERTPPQAGASASATSEGAPPRVRIVD